MGPSLSFDSPYLRLSQSGWSVAWPTSTATAMCGSTRYAEVVAPRNQLGGFQGGNNVTRGRKAGAFSVMGDYPDILRIQSHKIEAGRFLSPMDLEERRKVCVIGTRVKELLFAKGEDAVGDRVADVAVGQAERPERFEREPGSGVRRRVHSVNRRGTAPERRTGC